MTKKRNRYSAKFKAKVALEALWNEQTAGGPDSPLIGMALARPFFASVQRTVF